MGYVIQYPLLRKIDGTNDYISNDNINVMKVEVNI